MKKAGVLLIILIVTAGVRLLHIKADPPIIVTRLSGSSSLYCDDGIYAHNARNKVRFGQWVTDDWNPFLYNPLLTGIYYAAFLLFGAQIVVVKAVNVLLGCLAVWIFFLIAARELPLFPATLVTLLLSLNLYFITFNRTGLLENFLLLSLLLTYYFFLRSRQDPRFGFLTGIFTALIGIAKFLFLPFVIVPTICIWLVSRQLRKYRRFWYYLSGGLVTGILWLLLIYLPNPAFFTRIGGSWSGQAIPASLGRALANLVGSPLSRFMVLAPLVAVLACWFWGKSIVDGIRRELDPGRLFLVLWMALIMAEIGILEYAPLRYFLPLILAGYLAAVFLLRDLMVEKSRFLAWGGLTGGLVLLVFFGSFPRLLLSRPSAFFSFPPLLRLMVVLALGILVILPLVHSRGRRQLLTAVLMAGVICAGFLAQRYFLHPTYRVESAANRIHRLPTDSFLLGQCSLRLAFDSDLPAVLAYPGWFNDVDTFTRFDVTHILSVEKFNEHRWIKQQYPAVFDQFRLATRMPYWDTSYILFERNKEKAQ